MTALDKLMGGSAIYYIARNRYDCQSWEIKAYLDDKVVSSDYDTREEAEEAMKELLEQ